MEYINFCVDNTIPTRSLPISLWDLLINQSIDLSIYPYLLYLSNLSKIVHLFQNKSILSHLPFFDNMQLVIKLFLTLKLSFRFNFALNFLLNFILNITPIKDRAINNNSSLRKIWNLKRCGARVKKVSILYEIEQDCSHKLLTWELWSIITRGQF